MSKSANISGRVRWWGCMGRGTAFNWAAKFDNKIGNRIETHDTCRKYKLDEKRKIPGLYFKISL